MITYVNTVLVGKGTPNVVTAATTANAGKYIIMNVSEDVTPATQYLDANNIADASKIKIGLITSKTTKDAKGNTIPLIKWSNDIKKADIKSLKLSSYIEDTEDTVKLDFTSADLTTVDDGGYNIVLRLTYKDTPTRYRKWTDSYNYVTAEGDTAVEIAEALANDINKQVKRARVIATASAGVLTLTAMPYDDDDTVDTINWANKVRFSADLYYTNPNGAGFSSKNKYSLNGLKIEKTPGIQYAASAKLVRDREAQAMGYLGILNRGEGTWPVIKPEMNVNLDAHYNVATLEFENMYRAADDIFRKTKQTVEIYDIATDWDGAEIVSALKAFVQ